MTIFKLLQRMQMMYHPVASPLLIGLSLPQLCYEKRYIEIPVLIVMPGFYTGLLFGLESIKVREDGFVDQDGQASIRAPLVLKPGSLGLLCPPQAKLA